VSLQGCHSSIHTQLNVKEENSDLIQRNDLKQISLLRSDSGLCVPVSERHHKAPVLSLNPLQSALGKPNKGCFLCVAGSQRPGRSQAEEEGMR
jgi:hypothetical protein